MRAPSFFTDIAYVGMRVARRLFPARLSALMMRHRLLLAPGLETSSPADAAQRYCDALASLGLDIVDKECLIFGYGGGLGTAAVLLRRGARFVNLYDKYAAPDVGTAKPAETRASGLDQSLVHVLSEKELPQVCPEVIVSSSVFEHVDNPASSIEELSRLTPETGVHLHFIDLRDHFFAFPFHMLCFSAGVWQRALNPPSNLNRLRAADFTRLFGTHFTTVECRILERDLEAFNTVKHRIRPEFLTGNDADDSATQILIVASRQPLHQGGCAGLRTTKGP